MFMFGTEVEMSKWEGLELTNTSSSRSTKMEISLSEPSGRFCPLREMEGGCEAEELVVSISNPIPSRSPPYSDLAPGLNAL